VLVASLLQAQRRACTNATSHPAAIDVLLAACVTLVAALLRLIRLGEIPYGVHPDEAQFGLDAIRITHEGWIGVYSHAALGIPTLNDYITAPGVWLLGPTAFGLRIGLALVGLAAVPLLYALVRVAYARAEAFFASLLLALSYWHLLYSRIAHMSVSYPTFLLGALLCIMCGLKGGGRAERRWFAAAGVPLGLSVYAYNIGFIAVLAVAVVLAVLTLVRYPSWKALRLWWLSPALCFGVALIVVLPFFWYISDPHAYFWVHIDSYRDLGVLRSTDYRVADTAGKIRIIGDQFRDFAATYAWRGVPDNVDASGVRPAFDPITLVLLVFGVVMAVRRWREPMVIASVCCVLIVPLPALLQRGAMTREPLGAAPFVAFLCALPLATLWRGTASEGGMLLRGAFAALAVAPVVLIGALTVHDYFWTWRYNVPVTRFVYHQEITSASLYMKTLPPDAYVLFYSYRHPLSLETRTFLAPDIHGEDRSSEFGRGGLSIERPPRPGPIVFVLLDDYVSLLSQIARRYPGGVVQSAKHDGMVDFYAYAIP